MFAGVGERTREGNDLYHEMIESVSISCISAPAAFESCNSAYQGPPGLSQSEHLSLVLLLLRALAR